VKANEALITGPVGTVKFPSAQKVQSILDFNAQVARRAFKFSVAQKQLHCENDFGTAHCVGSIDRWIELTLISFAPFFVHTLSQRRETSSGANTFTRRWREKNDHIKSVASGPAGELNATLPSPPLHAWPSESISQLISSGRLPA
jgi:hypothetical protein